MSSESSLRVFLWIAFVGLGERQSTKSHEQCFSLVVLKIPRACRVGFTFHIGNQLLNDLSSAESTGSLDL